MPGYQPDDGKRHVYAGSEVVAASKELLVMNPQAGVLDG
jgi:hypothetical protein